MNPSPIRIEPTAGYSPTIARLVGMLTYARSTTMIAVEGLTMPDLDHLHDAESNSIGALLAHITAVERSYQVLTFEERTLTPEENGSLAAALKLGALGRAELRGKPLSHYLDELAAVRAKTLEMLAARDDDWLERSVTPAPRINAHWAWFHVLEDEVNHRGQIRWLRTRLQADRGDAGKNLESISPFFIVKDLDASISHYVDRFGFQLDFQGPPDDVYYAHVSRDGIGIMLKAITPKVLPVPNHTRHDWARWDAYIYTLDPDSLFAEFKQRGANFVKELSFIDDGLWGFEVTDADGYVLAFFRTR